MKVKEQKNTTGINIIFAGNREEKQHNRGWSYTWWQTCY
jgi:hypothetical protein